MKKVIVILIIIIIPAAIVLINLFLHKNYLDADTFKDVRYIYQYANLREEKGKPVEEMAVRVTDDAQIWLVVYDDIAVVYAYYPENMQIGYFMHARISNDTYTFGNKKIAVGMSREQVERILKNSKRPKPAVDELYVDLRGEKLEQPQVLEDYFDDDYENGLGFVYDENDCVEYIYVYDSIM